MAVFSTNQARQLYVAKTITTPKALASDAAGTIAVATDTDKNHMYFTYKGADNLMRSDLIDINNIMSVKVSSYKDMQRELKSVTVELDSAYLSEGKPISGQDYILRITFRNYVGMSDADQYFKYGMVHAHAGMTVSDFYKKLAISLAKNFSREPAQLLNFTLTDSDDEAVPVDATTKESDLTGTYKNIVIDEVAQDWTPGKMEQVPVYFEVQPTTITVGGDEVIWGIAEDTDPSGVIENGKKIADLEYFCMGERGDIYRGAGYPNDIKTTYLVDPTIAYNVVDIHYAYVGSNESVQKSEKDITIVIPSTVNASSNLIGKITEVFAGIVFTTNAASDPNLKTQ